jgi:hypothetical protein
VPPWRRRERQIDAALAPTVDPELGAFRPNDDPDLMPVTGLWCVLRLRRRPFPLPQVKSEFPIRVDHHAPLALAFAIAVFRHDHVLAIAHVEGIAPQHEAEALRAGAGHGGVLHLDEGAAIELQGAAFCAGHRFGVAVDRPLRRIGLIEREMPRGRGRQRRCRQGQHGGRKTSE